MIGNPPSNFIFLQRNNRDIVTELRDGDGTGRPSTMSAQRYTFVFSDGSKLHATERIVNGKIEYYYYDWISPEGKEILKFHSEPHDDEEYQTETEPYHIHAINALGQSLRLPNFQFRDLDSIMNVIRLFLLAKNVK